MQFTRGPPARITDTDGGRSERWPGPCVFLTEFAKRCIAHSRCGIVTETINISIGDFGEVFVLDWGLVCCLNEEETDEEKAVTDYHNMVIDRMDFEIELALGHTGDEPEQARGRQQDVGPVSDVFQAWFSQLRRVSAWGIRRRWTTP